MSSEDKKGSPNLNTIYEEFDLSDRIKALKGKHIKIKKIVKKEDGNYTIRETSLFSDKSVDNTNEVKNEASPGEPALKHTHSLTDSSPILGDEFKLPRSSSLQTSEPLFKKTNEPKNLTISNNDHSGGGFSSKKEPVVATPMNFSSPPINYQRESKYQDYAAPSRVEMFMSGAETQSAYSTEIANNLESPDKVRRGLPQQPEGSKNLWESTYAFSSKGNEGSVKSPLEDKRSSNLFFQPMLSSSGKPSPMYQSNYLEESGKKTFKHSNSIASEAGGYNRQAMTSSKYMNSSTSGSPANPMRSSNYNDMPLSQYYETLLNNRAKERGKDSSHMFRSQSVNRQSGTFEKAQDALGELKQFTLPPEVTKFIEEEEYKMADLKLQIKEQKDNLDRILDDVLTRIKKILDLKRTHYHNTFDQYLKDCEKVTNSFQRRVALFKDSTRSFGQHKFSGSGDRLVKLEKIDYLLDGEKTSDQHCNVTCKLSAVSREVEKRFITHLAHTVDRSLLHGPTLSLTETAKEYLNDMTNTICDKVSTNLEIIDSLIFSEKIIDIDGLSVKPTIKPSVGEGKTNILANVHNLLESNTKYQAECITGNSYSKITCLCLIEDEIAATGHEDCSITLWNLAKKQAIAVLEEHSHPINAMTSIKAYYPEISKAGMETTSHKLPALQDRAQKQQSFLVSGCSSNEAELVLWDLQSKNKLRSFKGHSDSITGLISLHDGHTVISSSLDGSMRVWDIAEDQSLTCHSEKDTSEILSLYAFNDYSHFITGSKSGDLNIYKISYVQSRKYCRTVFESCKKVKTIKAGHASLTLNEFTVMDHTLVSAGSQKSLTLWNTVTCAEQKRLQSHDTEIIACALAEDPLQNKGGSYSFSLGNYDDRIMITDIQEGACKHMEFTTDVSIVGDKNCSPILQFMPTTDVFGKSTCFLLAPGSKNGMPCIVKIQLEKSQNTANE